MRLNSSNLALEKDESNRFLPWLIAFMALLAALSIAGFLLLKQISNNFKNGSQDNITVQIPASETSSIDKKNIAEAKLVLKNIKGVISVKHITNAEIQTLLEPWLGKSTQDESLPLPQIIDIRIDRTLGFPYKKIKNKLETSIPGTTVHDHNVWVSSLVATLQSAELIALAIVVLITMATIGTVIFTTRTGMGIHKQTIEVLHFVGAHDNFIARQFATRAFIVGLQGGICGVILASPILYLFQYILTKMETGLLPYSTIDGTVLIGVGLVIPIVSLIAMFTAQSTVLKTLRKMV